MLFGIPEDKPVTSGMPFFKAFINKRSKRCNARSRAYHNRILRVSRQVEHVIGMYINADGTTFFKLAQVVRAFPISGTAVLLNVGCQDDRKMDFSEVCLWT